LILFYVFIKDANVNFFKISANVLNNTK